MGVPGVGEGGGREWGEQLREPGKSEVKVAQSCLTFCDPRDCTVHGILQARILEWVAFPFSRGSSQLRSPTLQVDSLPAEPQEKPQGTKARIQSPTLKGFSAVRWLSGAGSNLPPAPGFCLVFTKRELPVGLRG